ncbi:hypothetical protein GJ496_000684 [Pomphorhynchus laevis]|nr:hypothetical protein GJ496_000684 [Pomphorhynchus laevis]
MSNTTDSNLDLQYSRFPGIREKERYRTIYPFLLLLISSILIWYQAAVTSLAEKDETYFDQVISYTRYGLLKHCESFYLKEQFIRDICEYYQNVPQIFIIILFTLWCVFNNLSIGVAITLFDGARRIQFPVSRYIKLKFDSKWKFYFVLSILSLAATFSILTLFALVTITTSNRATFSGEAISIIIGTVLLLISYKWIFEIAKYKGEIEANDQIQMVHPEN